MAMPPPRNSGDALGAETPATPATFEAEAERPAEAGPAERPRQVSLAGRLRAQRRGDDF